MSNQWWSEQPGSGVFEMAQRAKNAKDPRKRKADSFHENCGGALARWSGKVKQPDGCLVCEKCDAVVPVPGGGRTAGWSPFE